MKLNTFQSILKPLNIDFTIDARQEMKTTELLCKAELTDVISTDNIVKIEENPTKNFKPKTYTAKIYKKSILQIEITKTSLKDLVSTIYFIFNFKRS